MFKGILNSVQNFGKTLDKPTFIKENDSTDKLLESLYSIQKEISDEDVLKKLAVDLSLIKYGNDGEKNVVYELKNSFIPMYILHDVTIQHEDYKAQMDFILITSKFICILETKKLNGNITINSDGDFIRHFKNRAGKTYKKEGMYSPISQNQRHQRILQDFCSKNKIATSVPIITLVVIANPKSIIDFKYVKKEIRNEIVKYDQLTTRLKSMIDGYESEVLSIPAMDKIGEALVESHCETENAFLQKYIEFVAPNQGDTGECDKEEVKKEIKVDSVDNPETLAIKETPKVETVVTDKKPKKGYKKGYNKEVKKTGTKQLKTNPVKVKTVINDNDQVSKLKAFRLKKSREENVKAYYVFSNKEMDGIIEKQPKTKDELLKCAGFGKVKVEKYGDGILGCLR